MTADMGEPYTHAGNEWKEVHVKERAVSQSEGDAFTPQQLARFESLLPSSVDGAILAKYGITLDVFRYWQEQLRMGHMPRKDKVGAVLRFSSADEFLAYIKSVVRPSRRSEEYKGPAKK